MSMNVGVNTPSDIRVRPSSSAAFDHAVAAETLTNLYSSLGSQRNDFRNDNLTHLICSMVDGRDVIDVGSGGGALIERLHGAGKRCCGIEPNQHLIDLTRQRLPDVEIFNGFGNVINQLGRQFDTVTIIDVLEHIEDDRDQLRRIYEALRPGGRLVVLVPTYPCLYGTRDVNHGHYRRYRRGELIGKLREVGFELRRVRYWNAVGVVPYWLAERVFRRELNGDLRTTQPRNTLKSLVALILYGWYRHVENRVNFRFGLSLICIASKPDERA